MTRAPLLAAAALACASCGAQPLMKLPEGPGTPAADAADALQQATNACRGVRTLTAEIAVSGSVAGHRIRGRLLAGVAAPVATGAAGRGPTRASARLEALAPFGPPVFIIVATGDDATLVLSRDDRVLEHGAPGAVLEAVAGVPLDATELHATLSGCPTASVPDGTPARVQGRQIGDWRIVSAVQLGTGDGEEWYLQHDALAAWRLVTVVHRSAARPWRAEYGDFRDGLPRSIRIAAEGRQGFDVRLVLSQVDVNVALGANVFRVDVPRTATPITLEELQRSGPFAPAPSHGR